MSGVEHLRTVGRGDCPADDGLLGNVRCGWGRGEFIGEESILAAFCSQPFDDVGSIAVETGQAAALIAEDDALIADVYNGRLGRIWRVGRGIESPQEPAIDIACDVDMGQQRGDIFFRAEDHVELNTASAGRILAAAHDHIEQLRRAGNLRVRAFVIRAFGTADAGAALLAIYSLDNALSRSASFSHAVVGIGSGSAPARVVSEHTPPRPWNPRF